MFDRTKDTFQRSLDFDQDALAVCLQIDWLYGSGRGEPPRLNRHQADILTGVIVERQSDPDAWDHNWLELCIAAWGE